MSRVVSDGMSGEGEPRPRHCWQLSKRDHTCGCILNWTITAVMNSAGGKQKVHGICLSDKSLPISRTCGLLLCNFCTADLAYVCPSVNRVRAYRTRGAHCARCRKRIPTAYIKMETRSWNPPPPSPPPGQSPGCLCRCGIICSALSEALPRFPGSI